MKPQKALHLYLQLEKKNPKLHGKQYMMFEKYDGWYGYLDTDERISSRQMREIPSMFHLDNDLAYNNKVPKGRLIFEILVKGVPLFKDLNGILNRKTEHAKDAYLMVHDFIPLGKESMPFRERYELAKQVVEMYNHPRVKLAKPLHTGTIVYDYHLWHAEANRIWSEGGEGLIFKDVNAPYSPGKKNSDILKIKLENSEEMLVTGVHVGQGKYSKTLGYLLVKDVHGVTHKVSGMSDTERDLWWADMDIIIGQVVEVQFMQRLANGSLREPRFKAVRHDKTAEELG